MNGLIDLTLACVPKYGFSNELEQVIPSRPAGLDGRSAADGPVMVEAIGIVGMMSYGTRDQFEFELGAEELVRLVSVCADVKTAWQRLSERRRAPRHNGGAVASAAGQSICGEEA